MSERSVENGAPIRLCCGERHFGPVCPDSKVMCCLCFKRFASDALAFDPVIESKVDVCQACYDADQTRVTPPESGPTPMTAVSAALAAFNAAVPEDRSDDWDKAVIDQAITHLAASLSSFSANDLRPLLPAVRQALISRRLIAAQHRKEIVAVGFTRSTLPSTHGAFLRVYAPVT